MNRMMWIEMCVLAMASVILGCDGDDTATEDGCVEGACENGSTGEKTNRTLLPGEVNGEERSFFLVFWE